MISHSAVTFLAALVASSAQASVLATRETIYRRAFDVSSIVPKSYDHCVLDPNTMGDIEFRLYDTKFSRSLVKVGDHIGISENMVADLAFKVSHPDGAKPGLNDFTADIDGDTRYMALFNDGTLGWANRSSNGQSDADGNIVTTLFALECNGRVHAGIDGAAEMVFSISDDDGTATLAPSSQTPSTLVAVPAEQHAQTELRRDLQKRDHPRCPAGKTAVDKVPKPVANPNGCGPANLPDFVPDGVYTDCCNQHDLCYSTCSAGFDQCNDNFLTCLQKKCDSEYKGFFKAPIRASCHAGARIYHGAVSAAGGSAFDSATEGSCNCV